MQESMIERLKITLRPFLHHGLDGKPDVETEAVRAVLTAMRDPLDVMVDAGEMTADGECDCMYARDVWEAMIDEALTEEC